MLLRGLPVLPFDAAAAIAYWRIIAQCGWTKGRDYDRMIAAHAISSDCVLVTNNEADFRDIPGLSVENWTAWYKQASLPPRTLKSRHPAVCSRIVGGFAGAVRMQHRRAGVSHDVGVRLV